MTYIIRNTIVLGIVLFLLLGAGGYLTFISLPKKINTLDLDIRRIETELQNTPDLTNQFDLLTAQLEDTKTRWETRSKDIPPQDITGETYGYLSRIIDVSGDVLMDIRYVGRVDSQRYGYNMYNLKGEASFASFFSFLWQTENGRRLLKIPNFFCKAYETKDRETEEPKVSVLYEIDVRAFYSPLAELNSAPQQRTELNPLIVASNPFYPLILREIPPPEEGEIEIERSELKAVIPGKAFIVDQEQHPRVLEEGDPVYLGYVTRILPEQGKIECLLVKGGVTEHIDLSIRVGQPLKK